MYWTPLSVSLFWMSKYLLERLPSQEKRQQRNILGRYSSVIIVDFRMGNFAYRTIPQQATTCSKSTTEILEKGMKHASKLTIKIPEWSHWRHSVLSIMNFDIEQANAGWNVFNLEGKYLKSAMNVVLVSLLLTLNIFHTFFLVLLLLTFSRSMFTGIL